MKYQDVLKRFVSQQAQLLQEKQMEQQLKEQMLAAKAQALGSFIPGERQSPQEEYSETEHNPFEEGQEYKAGGIHIDPSKKGTFKAQATRMGMSIQEAASHILNNKEKYSSAMVKKANFAKNFAKEEGGMIKYPDGGDIRSVIENTSGPRNLSEYYDESEEKFIRPRITGNEPEDYEDFLRFSETAPPNRRPRPDYKYGDSNEYDHYGLWDSLGKPKDFKQALEFLPDWKPDPYDGMYHGFSTNPKTGVFLKAGKPGLKPGDTTWMETSGFELHPHAHTHNLVFDVEMDRFRYLPKEKKQGGEMIRRADGSYSQRGLWDNIRANKGSGKKPTKEMLEQERKINNKYPDGGITKTFKSKDGTITNVKQNADGSKTVQVRTKDGKYSEKVIPMDYWNKIENLNNSFKEDEIYENILEFVDPTGISSYDDVQRAYDKNGLFDTETMLEIAGALPLIGKFGKVTKGLKLGTDAFKEYKLSKMLRGVDAAGKTQQAADIAFREGGSFNNPGFNALPEAVQDKIIAAMMYGGNIDNNIWY